MKKTIILLLFLCFLLGGCETVPTEVQPLLEVTEQKPDVIPFAGERDWFLYRERIFKNIEKDGQCYVLSASLDGAGESTVVLEDGHIFDRMGSVVIAAGNGQLQVMDLEEDAPAWTTLLSFSPQASFRFGFPAEGRYILYTTIDQSVTVDGKQITIDPEGMTAELSVPSRRIEALVEQGEVLYFVQRTTAGYTLQRANADFTDSKSLATVEERPHYFAVNDGYLMNYRVRYVPDDPLPTPHGHTYLLSSGDVEFLWIYDTKQGRLLFEEETKNFIIQGYTCGDYRLSYVDDQWQIVGNGTQCTFSLPNNDSRFEGFSVSEDGIILDQGSFYWVDLKGRIRAISI